MHIAKARTQYEFNRTSFRVWDASVQADIDRSIYDRGGSPHLHVPKKNHCRALSSLHTYAPLEDIDELKNASVSPRKNLLHVCHSALAYRARFRHSQAL